MVQRRRRSPGSRLTRSLVAAAVATLALGALVAPAGARQPKDGPSNPGLSVSQSTLPANGASTITVTGTDYLVPDHPEGGSVFGGVYVMFGWVQPGGGWGPSYRNSNNNQGTFGTTYTYPGDNGGADTRDDGSGLIRLVAFTPGGVSGAETDYVMDPGGNWSTQITIHGSTYTFKNNVTGVQSNVDCTQFQCGVFTMGAHGKSSRTNELFTPINFAGPPPPPSNTQPPVNTPAPNPGGGGGTNPPAATNPSGGTTPTPPSGGSNGGGNNGTAGDPGSTTAPETTDDPAATSTESATTTTVAGASDAAAAAQRALDAELAASGRDAGSVPVGPLVAVGAIVVVALLGGGGFLMWRRMRTGEE